MGITIRASFLPHDDPDPSMAFYRGRAESSGDRCRGEAETHRHEEVLHDG